MPHLKTPSPVPRNLGVEPCLDLINSRFSDHLGSGRHYDRVRNPVFQRWFLNRWGYEVKLQTDPPAWARLARLRKVLREALELYLSGRRLPESMRSRLESEMNRATTHWHLDIKGTKLQVSQQLRGDDWQSVFAAITLSAVRLISDRRPVKVCANPNCSWMFVDESRPGSRRWCDSTVCGSLFHVRRFRATHRA